MMIGLLVLVVAIAAFVVCYDDSGRASSGGAVNLMLASHAFLIGIVALITAIVAWFTALRSSQSRREPRNSAISTAGTGQVLGTAQLFCSPSNPRDATFLCGIDDCLAMRYY